jgi:hypothetical protein
LIGSLQRFNLEEHFNEVLSLVTELVNYGSNLIPRCFASSERAIPDMVIIGALLQHAVTMLDAIEVLLSQGGVYSAFIQARSLFETRLYLTWILQEDTIRRTRQYFVWHRRDEALWARRSVPGTPEHEKFHLACAGLLNDGKTNEFEDDARRQLEEITKILSGDDFKDINKKFDELKKPGKDFDVAWYQPWGPNSVADMANRLRLSGEYMLFYSMFSKATHCQAFRRHLHIGENGLHFQPIRDLKDISTVLNISLSYTINIYHMILERYRPYELDVFRQKYATQWRKRFWNIPCVLYGDLDKPEDN